MAKQLLTKGQEEYESAKAGLKTAVHEDDRALDHGQRKMDAKNFSITTSKVFICLKI